MNSRYWLQTLGCPKNQVDSDKLAGTLEVDGFTKADEPAAADLIVVNTCAFIEAARRESIDTILELAEHRSAGARLVVTGCMAERYGDELEKALPEVDLVAGFGVSLLAEPREAVPVSITSSKRSRNDKRISAGEDVPTPANVTSFDLLELPRPTTDTPWAYVKVAEGCDRKCGFCAIPSFRGPQRSRGIDQVLDEVTSLVQGHHSDSGAARGNGAENGGAENGGVKEIVLVAQDLASFGRDRLQERRGFGLDSTPLNVAPIVTLTRAVSQIARRTRLLYLYPSNLTDDLIAAILETGVAYFDLSLQHVSRPLLRRMRRWGDASRFLERINFIRQIEPSAAFRSSFILGYPGESEEDHDQLLEFLEVAQLDWAGFFAFSPEEGTHAAGLIDQVPAELAVERLRECSELQDAISARKRDRLVGQTLEVLIDAPGKARSVFEAPEIDGIIRVPETLKVGSLVDVLITGSLGMDLEGQPCRVIQNSTGQQINMKQAIRP